MLEYFRLVLCELREHLAVQRDVSLFQAVNESRVIRAMHMGGCRNFYLPETPEISFFRTPIPSGIDPSFRYSSLRLLKFFLPAPFEAFGAPQDIFSVFDVRGASFDSWHNSFRKLVKDRARCA